MDLPLWDLTKSLPRTQGPCFGARTHQSHSTARRSILPRGPVIFICARNFRYNGPMVQIIKRGPMGLQSPPQKLHISSQTIGSTFSVQKFGCRGSMVAYILVRFSASLKLAWTAVEHTSVDISRTYHGPYFHSRLWNLTLMRQGQRFRTNQLKVLPLLDFMDQFWFIRIFADIGETDSIGMFKDSKREILKMSDMIRHDQTLIDVRQSISLMATLSNDR